MGYYIGPNGYYEGDYVAEGSAEVPPRPDLSKRWDGAAWVFDAEKAETEKLGLLAIARANREIILNRLTGHYIDADVAGDTVAKAAILVCRASLKNIMQDQRVIAAVDGEAKAAVLQCYAEIISTLAATAPQVLVAFKDLDAL